MPLSRLVEVETNRIIHLDLFLILLQSSQGMALGVTEDYTGNTCSDSSSSLDDSMPVHVPALIFKLLHFVH